MCLCPDISGSKERQRARFQGELWGPWGDVGEPWGGVGEQRGDVQRCGEMYGAMGVVERYGEPWGDVGSRVEI